MKNNEPEAQPQIIIETEGIKSDLSHEELVEIAMEQLATLFYEQAVRQVRERKRLAKQERGANPGTPLSPQ